MDAGLLIAELKRRRVFRALIGYGIAAFAVLQIVEPLMHGFHWPDEVLTYVVSGLAAGFPLVIALAWIFDVNAGRIERTASAAPQRAWYVPALLGLGVLAAAPGLLYYFVVRARPPAAQAPAPEAAGPSIAVLPLLNLSRDPDQDYFADGLAEELLDLLAKVPGLRVAARTSAFSFKGKNDDMRTIAAKLQVSTVLEGSVRKSGEQVRITTQLISAANGYHLWSETYDRKLTDVFAVQDDIAKAVVEALKLKLLPAQVPTSKGHRTTDPEVYTQYLLGRQFLSRSRREGYLQAAQAFEKALAIEPSFAPAWAGLATADFWIADSADTAQEVAAGQLRAQAAAEKAVALGPDLPEGYAARGLVRSGSHFDWKGAAADFERALQISPEDAEANREYANSGLRPLGRIPEAIVYARKAAALDPLNGQAWSTLGGLLVSNGQFGPARDALERSLEINPEQAFAPGWLGVLLVVEGRPEAALPFFNRSTSEFLRLTGAATAQHSLGHAKESQQALDALISGYGHNGAYQIAAVYAWRGENDRAFQWLERARTQHDGGLTMLKTDPTLRGLRADPRYPALLRELNLPVE